MKHSTVYFNTKELPIGVEPKGIVGLDFPHRRYFEFEGRVSSEIAGRGESPKDNVRGSITTHEMATLRNLYLLSQLRKVELTKERIKLLDYLFDAESDGHGFVLGTVVDFTDKTRKSRDGYLNARMVSKPSGIVLDANGDIEQIIEGKDSTDVYAFIPDSWRGCGGFVEMTSDGDFNPETGLPFSLVKYAEQAQASYMNKGFEGEFSRRVSIHFSVPLIPKRCLVLSSRETDLHRRTFNRVLVEESHHVTTFYSKVGYLPVVREGLK